MLIDKIESDIKESMKSKDQTRLETLRMLKAAIGNFLIEKKKDRADDGEVLVLIQKQVKLRQDSIESFQKGGRKDLVDKETKEKGILEAYLPKQLSDAELQALVNKVVQETGATTKADMGKTMKEVLAQSKGRADGKRVSQILAAVLTA